MKNWIRVTLRRIRTFFRGSVARGDLDREIAFHIDMLTEQNIRSGMSPKQARAAAIREFGHVEGVREACKETWGIHLLEELTMDLRDASRQVLKNQGHTFAIILTLGICIGSNTTAINLVQKVVSKPYSFENDDRIVLVGKRTPRTGQDQVGQISVPQYVHLKEQTDAFLELGFVDDMEEYDLENDGNIQRVRVDLITPEVWSITGVSPVAGRLFTEDEAQRNDGRIVVLSETLANRLSDDPENVLDSTIQLDGEPYQVVGVAPKSFHLAYARSDAWLPRMFEPNEFEASRRNDHSWLAIAKLKPGVSVEQADQRLRAIYESYLDKYPEDRDTQKRTGATFGAVEINKSINEEVPEIGMAFRSTQLVTLIVLAIGCLNVSGMFLVKSYAKLPDYAMRKALGATSFRLFRQMATEVCLYFFLGGLASLVFLRLGFWAAEALYITEIPWAGELQIDAFSLIATAAVAFVAALITSLLPVLSVLRRDLNDFVKSNGRTATSTVSKHRLHSFFVISQISLSVILLVISGILASNLYQTLQKDLGLVKEGRVAFEVPQPEYRFGRSLEDYESKILPYQERILETLRSIPAVVSASATNRVPMSPYQTSHSVIAMDHYAYQPGEPQARILRIVTRPGYFKTIGAQIVSGRDFEKTDTFDSEKVVIVSQNLVDAYYANHEPIGSTLTFWGETLRIVGVAADVQDKPYFMNWQGHTLYFPYTQWHYLHQGYTTYVAHLQGNVLEGTAQIEQALRSVDPALTFSTVPLEASFELATFAQRLPMVISVFFGALALLLSGLGIYGLISYVVAERAKELGIRMAFGASPQRILKRILAGSGKLVGWGLAAGLAVAVPLSVKINPLLSDIDAANPAIFATVTVFVAAISAAACLIPARRATRIDIAQTLRV